MPPIRPKLLLLFASCAIPSSAAAGEWLNPCSTARLISSWKHDGLWLTSAVDAPPISVDGHDVRYVGKLRAGGLTYKIYYDQNSEPGSEAHDAAHDLIVTNGRGKFLGLYNIADITDVYDGRVRTEGSDVVFETEKNEKGSFLRGRIHFSLKGPPRTTNPVFGYSFAFQTPAEFQKSSPRLNPWPEPGPQLARYCRDRPLARRFR